MQTRVELTAREREQMNHEKEMFTMQAVHVKQLKAMELEIARSEAKWTNILRLPLTLIRVPLLIVFGIAYCIAMVRDKEPSEDFWRLMRL